ncbi:MAG: ExsB family transcriptional regulator, partial [Candidatus Omnitrophica bacterium]|nr:ExsB family transcriptional regulator [Candidatus Omnitrophota bacterium]
MSIQELKTDALDAREFIERKAKEIASTVGSGLAINALSGGVDSSCVTMLGHKALGDRLKTYFINNGLMREGEPAQIVSIFEKLGVKVEAVDAQEAFFEALRGVT